MQTAFKDKLMREIEQIPDDKMPKLYRMIHVLTEDLVATDKNTGKRGSLKGIWKGSKIDDELFGRAKSALFPYQNEKG